jgi:hypothetical protein
MHTKLINLKESILRDLETNKNNENNISFKVTYANEMFLNGKLDVINELIKHEELKNIKMKTDRTVADDYALVVAEELANKEYNEVMGIVEHNTKLTSHNKYNSKILLNKKYWQELGFKENDKVSISKLEDGKVLIERIGDDEK